MRKEKTFNDKQERQQSKEIKLKGESCLNLM